MLKFFIYTKLYYLDITSKFRFIAMFVTVNYKHCYYTVRGIFTYELSPYETPHDEQKWFNI
jgi:hypothetical protein